MKSNDEIVQFISKHSSKHQPLIRGRWHNLQIRPDLATSEVLNFGVVFVDSSNRIHLKLATDFRKLRCFYGEHVNIESFESLSEMLLEAYSGAKKRAFNLKNFSPNIHITKGAFASGYSVNDILSDFYSATVTIARDLAIEKNDDVKGNRAKSFSSDSTRLEVFRMLRQSMGLKAESFIAKGPFIIRDEVGENRKIQVPIRKPGVLAASIVSIWSKDPYKRKYQMVQAGLDLDTVKKNSPSERLGLFVLRPWATEGYSAHDLQVIDQEVDEVQWQLKKIAGVQLEQDEDIEQLSVKVEEWLSVA